LILALSAITAKAFLSKSTERKLWLTVWMASAIGFLVVIAAPGNYTRMATQLPVISYRDKYSTVAKGSLEVIHSYILPWSLDFKHWLLAVLLWFDPRVASLRNRLPGWSSFGAISSFLLVWVSIVIIAIAVTIWNVGGQPAGRTMNLIYGMFLTGWIALTFLVTRPLTFSIHPSIRAASLSTALLLLSTLAVTSNNTFRSIGDAVQGGARSWETELNRRFVLLRSAGRDAEILLPTVAVRPENLPWDGITEDPNFWANRCLSRYFGVASVRTDETISK
jgi:hypothetical protein